MNERSSKTAEEKVMKSVGISTKINNISIQDIWEARRRMTPLINKTPLIQSTILSERIGRPVYLKLETAQNWSI